MWPVADCRRPSSFTNGPLLLRSCCSGKNSTADYRTAASVLSVGSSSGWQTSVSSSCRVLLEMGKAEKSLCLHQALVGSWRGQEGTADGVDDFGRLIGRAWQAGSSRRHRPAERSMGNCDAPRGERFGKPAERKFKTPQPPCDGDASRRKGRCSAASSRYSATASPCNAR